MREYIKLTAMAVCLSLFSLVFHANAGKPIQVVATTGMIADAAIVIGGDAVNVKSLMGSGVDPHAYRQTRSDILAMSKADIVLWHGLFLEAQLEAFMKKLSKRGNVFAVAETLPKSVLLAHDDYDDKFDPHVWMDPEIWVSVIDNISDILSQKSPENKEIFVKNAFGFKAEIEKLKAYSNDILGKIPNEKRVLVTAHDAFNYFGKAYGFDVLGIQGLSTESEAGIKRIQELVNVLVNRKIGAVFIESSVSDRNILALIEGAAAQGHRVDIGGELFSDAMGEFGTYEGTYLGMIDHNVTTVAKALGVEVDATGLNGKLTHIAKDSRG